jgi:hypothetical protein
VGFTLMFVNGHNLEVRETIEQNAERESAHSTEAIDGDSDRRHIEGRRRVLGDTKRRPQRKRRRSAVRYLCVSVFCAVVVG